MKTLRFNALLLFVLLAAGCATTTVNEYGGVPDPAQHEKAALLNYQLGVEYMQMGRLELAEDKLLRAISTDKGIPEAYNALGVLYEQRGQPGLAVEQYRRALDLQSNYTRARINYGRVLCATGQGDRGASELGRVVDTGLGNPVRAEVLEGLGMCSLVEGDPDRAEEYFREALTLEPRLSRTLLEMSNLTLERGDVEEARSYLSRYDTVTRASAKSLFLAYKIERELGNRSLQQSYRSRVLTEFPDSPEAVILRGEQG
jgi:type IV pilus assembly protein PilF